MMQRTIQDIRERSAVLYCPFPAKKQEFYDRKDLLASFRKNLLSTEAVSLAVRS